LASDLDAVRAEVGATRKLRGEPFGAKLQVMNPRSQELAQLLVDERVGAVTISGGYPKAHAPPAGYLRDPFSQLSMNDGHLYPDPDYAWDAYLQS
jgi:hypothetical protein